MLRSDGCSLKCSGQLCSDGRSLKCSGKLRSDGCSPKCTGKPLPRLDSELSLLSLLLDEKLVLWKALTRSSNLKPPIPCTTPGKFWIKPLYGVDPSAKLQARQHQIPVRNLLCGAPC